MTELLNLFTGGGSFMPHGHCYLWQPALLWLNLLSDASIALAYFSLPAALIYFVYKRRDLVFKPLFVMFGVFILACGMTHVMAAWTIWVPAYWLDGSIKAVTAAASLITAAMVWIYFPRALALPSPAQLHEVNSKLERVNQQLQKEVATRRAAEERFRGLLESAPDAIIIVDGDGLIDLVNSQTEKWFGYSREELIGAPVDTLVPERFRAGHRAHRDGYTRKPAVRPMGAEIELYGVRKDGSEFPVEISLSPMQTEQGLLVTSIIRDVTARKQAQQAQEQVRARYQELVNNLPVGVYRNTPGPEGRFLEVNPALVEMVEAESAEEVLAHSVSDLYCNPAERDRFVAKIMQQGSVSGEELHLKTLKGRKFHAAITAVKKQSAGGEPYFDGIIEDVSARKENERRIRELNDTLRARSAELETINRELEAFSYSVSHDLRAPLRAMDGFSHSLLNDYADRLDDKGRDRLGRVRNAAQHMATLIDDLLKLSRVSRSQINREAVDLGQLAGEVMETLRQSDPQRSVTFSAQPDLTTQGDARLLRVVMDNLLGNAWKFTGRKSGAEIEVGARMNGNDHIYFVRDNGAGFNMSYADKLFGAFQRLHDTGEFPGTGIGLATVQRVIHKHGGRIWAESEVGRGATFYFTLNDRESI